MRQDFTPNNIELWIDNWKRKDVVGNIVAKSWLDSFPFEKINIIVNHSSVVIEDFPLEIRPKIKLWNNVMRHDNSRGPINRNINQAYVHTFLSGKRYCIVAHDSYRVKPGWHQCVINSDYDLYMAPQGDGMHIITLEGLKTFGWWDERYATMGWHEVDYLCRVMRKSFILNQGKCSVVDYHGLWPRDFDFVNQAHQLHYNSVGLESFISRFDTGTHPRIGERANPDFTIRAEAWHRKKWTLPFDHQPHGSGTLYNLIHGPREEEIDWYPWLDLQNLKTDRTDY